MSTHVPIKVPKEQKEGKTYIEHQWTANQRPSKGLVSDGRISNNSKITELGNFTYLGKEETWCLYSGVELVVYIGIYRNRLQ